MKKQKIQKRNNIDIGFRIFQLTLYIIFLSVSLLIAYILNSLLEVIFGIIVFTGTRYLFSKTYHADSTSKCLILSILVFVIYAIITPKINISLLSSVLLGYLISLCLYYIEDYIELKESLKVKKSKKIYKGIDDEELHSIIDNVGLTEMDIKLLEDFYCKRKNLTMISYELGYTYEYTSYLKSSILKKISNYYKDV